MTPRQLAILLRDAAAIHGPTITPSKFLSTQAQLEPQLLANILAGWAQLRREAGLPECAPRFGRKRFTDDDLLVDYDRVRTALGKDPTWAEINRHSAFSRQTYQDRIGTIRELRAMHREWAELRDRAALGDPDAGAALAHRTRTLPAPNLFASVLPDLTLLPPLLDPLAPLAINSELPEDHAPAQRAGSVRARSPEYPEAHLVEVPSRPQPSIDTEPAATDIQPPPTEAEPAPRPTDHVPPTDPRAPVPPLPRTDPYPIPALSAVRSPCDFPARTVTTTATTTPPHPSLAARKRRHHRSRRALARNVGPPLPGERGQG
jgi:hypothetical protein